MMEFADNSLAKNDFFAGKILFEKFEHLTSLQAAPTQPFVARLKRPSLLAMAKNGKIPNELLVKTNELFMNDGTAVNASDDNMLKEIFSVIDTIAGEVFVQPTYKEIKEAGVQLTDEQMLFIFNYTQTGVKNLENFRED